MTDPATPSPGDPLVSIVLAASGGWDETFRLLLALVGSTGRVAAETIVVDDGTTDETALALPRLPGLRLLRNEHPLGPAVARRQGAALARGRFIAFLPAQAAPEPGWLERLLAEAGVGADGTRARPSSPAGPADATTPDLADPPPPGGLLIAADRLAGAGPATGAGPRAPRFTILVPTYNHARYLPGTLASLRAQTFPDWEAVVVDDGSTDETPRVLAELAAGDPRFRTFRQPNGGVSTALNEGLRQARGEWICWLSSDDLFEPDALATFVRGAADHPDCRFFHADFYYLLEETGQKGATVDGRRVPERAAQTIGFFRDNPVNGITICLHRGVFERVGTFQPRFRYAQDVDMWLRASAHFPYVRLRHHVATTRIHRQSGTSGFPQAGPYEVARACLEFLNGHPFPALFPVLDLTRLEHVVQALEATFMVIATHDAHIYQGLGPGTALLDRLQEWFAGDCPAAFRAPIAEAVGPLADRLRAQGLAPPVAAALDRLRTASPAPFRYQPVDPVEAMSARLRALEAAGDPEAAPLRRYVDMAATPPPGAAASRTGGAAR